MEKLFSHNRVKTHNGTTLNHFVESEQLGYYFSDRVLLTNKQANLSTEPDGTFVSFSALEDKRVRFVGGSEGDFVELVGTPDMVLEIVSRFSVTKDSKVLRELYRRAEIREYWLVDARDDPMQFDILRLSSRGYLPSRRENGWVKSAIFGRSFALQKKKDRLGNPQYWLQVKE
jgi:Uma2 family endonuclease